MAEYDGISDFVTSGLRRLRDAEELMQAPTLAPKEAGASFRHMRGAMYLAGYGIECHLKALLIREVGQQRLGAARDVLAMQRSALGMTPLRDMTLSICSV